MSWEAIAVLLLFSALIIILSFARRYQLDIEMLKQELLKAHKQRSAYGRALKSIAAEPLVATIYDDDDADAVAVWHDCHIRLARNTLEVTPPSTPVEE
jgi:hypothetical protein